jgi:NitT/TauT family transport system substrate-binding protein
MSHGLPFPLSCARCRGRRARTDRFGFADAIAMARLVSKGLPARMIANYVRMSPLAIIFFADKDIKAPKNLEGRTIAFTAGVDLERARSTLL